MSVLLKLKAPLLVVIVSEFTKTTGDGKIRGFAPLTVTSLAKLIELGFPVKERFVKAAAPTVPVKVTGPVVETTNALAPLVVPVIEIAPDTADRVIGVAVRVKLPPILNAVLVVATLFAKLTSPVVLNPPLAVMTPVAPFVNRPVLVTPMAPVVVKLLLTE